MNVIEIFQSFQALKTTRVYKLFQSMNTIGILKPLQIPNAFESLHLSYSIQLIIPFNHSRPMSKVTLIYLTLYLRFIHEACSRALKTQQ